jgi:hypothetical protein
MFRFLTGQNLKNLIKKKIVRYLFQISMDVSQLLLIINKGYICILLVRLKN